MTMTTSFESALQGRIDAMTDACTRCGKCVEVCPATEPAGLSTEQRQNPAEVIGGVIDSSAGNDAARKWASGCLLSGDCIKACDYGVNPRFLLGMVRVAMAKAKDDAATQRRAGVEGFREVARGVNALSRLQLDGALLARLGQVPKQNAAGELPDFVFYTGCNVLKTPHIALLALDVMDALGISYEAVGGPIAIALYGPDRFSGTAGRAARAGRPPVGALRVAEGLSATRARVSLSAQQKQGCRLELRELKLIASDWEQADTDRREWV
jgi:ferredoxin